MTQMNKRERISEFVGSLEVAAAKAEEDRYYVAFFTLWNARKYYEAHDVLEQLWLAESDPERARFYQALIQAAGAFVHLQKNFEHPAHPKHGRRLRPATRLFTLSLKNLESLPAHFRGLDVPQFQELLISTRQAIVSVDYQRNPWSPEAAPQLALSSSFTGA